MGLADDARGIQQQHDDWDVMRAELIRSMEAKKAGERAEMRALIHEFITELQCAEVRSRPHARPDSLRTDRSITVRGWSLSGCQGGRRGCSTRCATVVTPAGELAVMNDQPRHRLLFPPRPVFVEDLAPPLEYDDTTPRDRVGDLKQKLTYGLSCLLPRQQ